MRRYTIHTVVDGDKVGALVGLDDGETDGDVEGFDVGLLVGEAVQPPLEVGDPSLHALAARLCVFFAISGASLSLFALPSTLSFLALPNRRSFRCDNVESRIYMYTGECRVDMYENSTS